MARRRIDRNIGQQVTLEKKQAILAALGRAKGETEYREISENPDSPDVYYTLSSEQIRALINGDLRKIESWVNGLDRQQATWLLRQLIKENW